MQNIFSSNDLILLAIVVASILIHVFFLNKKRMMALLFAIYSSYLVILFTPFDLWFQNADLLQIIWIKTYCFLGLILLLMIIFSRAHIFAVSRENIIFRFIKKVLFGILNIGLIFALLTTILPWDYINRFSKLALNVFNKTNAMFIWIVAPLIILLFSVRIGRRKGPGRPRLD